MLSPSVEATVAPNQSAQLASVSFRHSLAAELRKFLGAARPWQLGPLFIAVVGLVGYADFLLGYQRSLLVGYLVPVALATWFLGRRFGLAIACLSVTSWIIADVLDGIPRVNWWNAAMGLISYAAFTVLLAKWRALLRDLDERVRERTSELQREIAQRKRLEREVALVTERERRRLGQDLHDSICQHLTGTALVAHAMSEQLQSSFSAEAERAQTVVQLLEEGIDLARTLARGCFSPDLEAEGLPMALEGLAASTQQSGAVGCEFEADPSVQVRDSALATQLYRIAQEAVTNALKHAHASSILIALATDRNRLTLTVADDGIGLPAKGGRSGGLGLQMMKHGAGLIHGELEIVSGEGAGATVRCSVPMPEQVDEIAGKEIL